MHKTENLCELLETILGKLGSQPDLSPSEVENAYKASKALYYLTVTKAMKEHEESEYSERGRGRSNSSYDYSMGSYMPESYRMGNMSRNNYYDNYGTSTRRYSRGDEREIMIEKLEDMMDDAVTKSEKETIQRCINKMQKG